MDQDKEEQEIEALLEKNAVRLEKPDAALLQSLSQAAVTTFQKDRRNSSHLSEHGPAEVQSSTSLRGSPAIL